MFLKRLEMQGFKSFPDKVRLEFHQGITAVVGPNGSGKSNISDAVRWVLGEQKIKSLRGDKMEDVIFSGTQNRRPLGFAEVSLTLDNQDGGIAIAYTDITVTRRLYRSGESEYRINGTPCRLKDIYELFMDTGIGREGYSIIGQGKIDEILSSRSEDRRRIFEEAAGIVKYKTRKNEAEQKLERERQNLTRLEDIIQELESQMEPLAEQAEAAKVYLNQREELKKTEITLFRLQAETLEKDMAAIEEMNSANQDHWNKQQSDLSQYIKQIADLKDEIEKTQAQVQQEQEAVVADKTLIEKTEGEIKVKAAQADSLTENITRLKEEIREQEEKTARNVQQIDQYVKKAEEIDQTLAKEREILKKHEESYRQLEEKMTHRETQSDAYKAEMIEQIKQTSDLKGLLEKAKGVMEQFRQREKQVEQERKSLSHQIQQIQSHREELNLYLEQDKEEEKELEAQILRLQDNNKKAAVLIQKLRTSLEEKTKQYHEEKSRYAMLKEMEKEYEGFYKSVRAILKAKEKNDPRFQGIYGPVGTLFQVEEKYETAIETALGSGIQNIITKTEEDARKSIAFLKANQLGRATFLPVSAVTGKSLEQDRDWLIKEKGILGIAMDKVRFDPIFTQIARNLLGRVIVADTLENAITFSKKYRYRYRIVTLEGDIINPGGAMTGGSKAKTAANIFSRTRQLQEAGSALDGYAIAIKALEGERNKAQTHLEETQDALVEAMNQSKEIQFRIAANERDLEESQRQKGSLEGKLRQWELEKQQITEQIRRTEEEEEQARLQLIEIEAAITALDEKLSLFQNDMTEEKQQQDVLWDTITKSKITVSQLEQQQRLNEENIQLGKGHIQDLQKAMEQKKEQILSYEHQMLCNTQQRQQLQEQIRIQKKSCEEREQKVENLRQEASQKETVLSHLQEAMDQTKETLAFIKNEMLRLEGKLERLQEDKKRIYDAVWEAYEVTYHDAAQYDVPQKSQNQLAQRVKELKETIRQLGDVNVNAIEQYTQTKERYAFLTAQREDIRKAEAQLIDLIRTLTRTMEKQFQDQLQGISESFYQVFREMFGGGKAYLKLSDEKDVLGSSIDIIAQPPGKSLQNMLLLSGGERALTAISILFSILRRKPSPFCILDEIEAALDDANVFRFAEYLKQFSDETQFIVITHRKPTMEAADVMYGITMQEQGVSKLVSVSFEQKDKQIEIENGVG